MGLELHFGMNFKLIYTVFGRIKYPNLNTKKLASKVGKKDPKGTSFHDRFDRCDREAESRVEDFFNENPFLVHEEFGYIQGKK